MADTIPWTGPRLHEEEQASWAHEFLLSASSLLVQNSTSSSHYQVFFTKIDSTFTRVPKLTLHKVAFVTAMRKAINSVILCVCVCVAQKATGCYSSGVINFLFLFFGTVCKWAEMCQIGEAGWSVSPSLCLSSMGITSMKSMTSFVSSRHRTQVLLPAGRCFTT